MSTVKLKILVVFATGVVHPSRIVEMAIRVSAKRMHELSNTTKFIALLNAVRLFGIGT